MPLVERDKMKQMFKEAKRIKVDQGQGQSEDDSDDDDDDGDSDDNGDDVKNLMEKFKSYYDKAKRTFLKPFQLKDDSDFHAVDDDCHTAVFRNDKKEYFNIGSDERDFFKASDRIRMVGYKLKKTKFGDKKEDYGIRKLLDNPVVFEKFYPLHDGFHRNKSDIKPPEPSLRMYLHSNWAQFRNLFKIQPLDQIRNYFGEKIALYFAFMGFYTYWLVVFAIIGLIVFIYGISTLDSSTYVNEMCQVDKIMCPTCDRQCNYWNFSEVGCSAVKVTYVFDNYVTLIYAFLVSLWATTFLEFWNRKNFALIYDWDLSKVDQDQEPIRHNYQVFAENKNQKRMNPVTLKREPYVTLSQRLPRQFFSVSLVIFSILLILGAVISVIIYRLAIETLIAKNESVDDIVGGTFLSQYVDASLIASVTASMISLVVIVILNYIYNYAALLLTEFELPRTQQQFDDSYAFKVFCFQFVNYYSTLFYIAFFKDPFVGYPGTSFLILMTLMYILADWNYIGDGENRFRWQGCKGGCNYELGTVLNMFLYFACYSYKQLV